MAWKRRYLTKRLAQTGLREAQVAADKGTYTEPSKRTLGSWLDEWVAGLRLAPSSVASYRKKLSGRTSGRTSAACRWPH